MAVGKGVLKKLKKIFQNFKKKCHNSKKHNLDKKKLKKGVCPGEGDMVGGGGFWEGGVASL